MTIKQKVEEIIKMRAAGDPSRIEEKNKSIVGFALNNILRGKQREIVDSTLVKNLVGEDGSALIPVAFKHDLDEKKIQNKSIRQFVDVIPVLKQTGSFGTEDESNVNKELVEFVNGVDDITEQNLKLKGVKWELKSYGSFTPIEERLQEDAEYDLLKLFMDNHAQKAVKTENKAVFGAVTQTLAPKALADVAALSTSLNVDFKPALEKEIVVVTNQDGFEVIKPNLQYFKNEEGKPKAFLGGYPVEVYSNDELPTTTGTVPVIYGSMKKVVKLFDLEKLEVDLIKHPFGIRVPVSVMKGVECFDVKLIPGSSQLLYGELTVS